MNPLEYQIGAKKKVHQKIEIDFNLRWNSIETYPAEEN